MQNLLIVVCIFAATTVSFCDEINKEKREIFDLPNQYNDDSNVYKNEAGYSFNGGVYEGYKSGLGVGYHSNYPNSYSYGGNYLNSYNGYNNNQNTPITNGYSIVNNGHTAQSYPVPVRVPQPVVFSHAQPVYVNGAGSGNGYRAGQYGNNVYGSGIYGNQKYGSGEYSSIEAGNNGNEYGNEKYNSGVYSANAIDTNAFEYGNQKYGPGVYSSNDVDQFGNNGLGDYENQKYGTGVYSSNEVGTNVYGTGVYGNQKYGSQVYSSNGASNNGYGYENQIPVYGSGAYGTDSFNNVADYNSGKYAAQYGSGLYNNEADNLKSNVYGSAYENKYEISPTSDSVENYNGQANNYHYGSNTDYNQDKDASTDLLNSGASGSYENKYNGNKNQASTYVNVKAKGYEYSYKY